MPSVVAIRRCPSYDPAAVQAAVSAAVAAAVDWPAAVAGKRVLIKVNLLADAPPARAVCTHPEVTRALIRVCRAAGAAEIAVGDMPGMQLTDLPEQAFEVSGTAAVCREESVRMAPFSRTGYREVEVAGARKLRSLLVANELFAADFVISAPKLKSHIQALYTGAIKNWFGVVASRDRKRAHHLNDLEPFSESLVDVFRTRPPDLAVMDAIVGMEGRGPGEGNPKSLGLILASPDAVALDAAALDCVDWTGMKTPHVRLAAEAGLGVADLAQITIDGPPIAEVRVPFEPPPTAFVNPPKFVVKWFYRLWRIRPRIVVANCQRCGACAKMCPVGAIAIGESAAVIDRAACIECFCCHEACPFNAVGEDMTLLYRAYRWFMTRRRLST